MTLAVIETGGKQYKIREGEVMTTEKIEGQEEVIFDKVLLVADEEKGEVFIGKPYLEGATVKAEILETAKGKKIYVERFKPKVRYHKKIGHRQWQIKLKIKKIDLSQI